MASTVSLQVIHEAIKTVVPDNQAASGSEESLTLLLDSYSGVISALQSCFSGRVKSTKSMKVKVQKNFHTVRVGSLPTIWEKVTADTGIPPLLALEFQSISRHLFNYTFKAEHTGGSDTREVTLLAEEENIVRYASGYVAMKLGKKFKK